MPELDELTEKLELLARIARTLVEKSADRYGVTCPVVRLVTDATAIRIVGGTDPRIDIGAPWLFGYVVAGSKQLSEAIDKAVVLFTDRAQATLSRPKPYSYEWVESARKYRKLDRSFTLPPRYFATTYTVRVTCPLTGRHLEAPATERNRLVVERKLQRQLTEMLYDDDTTAELLDTIEAARLEHATPAVPERITLVPFHDGYMQVLDYAAPEPATFDVATLYTNFSPL